MYTILTELTGVRDAVWSECSAKLGIVGNQNLSTKRLLYWLYRKRLIKSIDTQPIPRHIGMIIDGNRRWAKQLGLSSAAEGHRAGAKKILEFLDWCDQRHIEMVTLYLLSSDNIAHRDQTEVAELSSIISELTKDIASHDGWKISHVGSEQGLDDQLTSSLRQAVEKTEANTGLQVNLAVGYGGRNEIVEAMRRILQKNLDNPQELQRLSSHLTQSDIQEHLYTGGLPDPDLVIRTSGEQRLSDFMVWQSAHSEFYFVEALGPNLREIDFLRALRDYGKRERRYGS